ncbi:inositol monophosphatase family protein [Burkholderia cenocepacia]|jgi:myo-inositol-1(or 4)-monophosphatase|uniref:inositol monophosphatase family protein n=2 Tax=Burkholderia cenocepacia TaxID=95486 RepID=UPI001F26AECB|nr:inositol monophosphatase family protein [Burkholderia cenocepacia]MDN7691279.1 inositol monophosphatase family protein [Burkholderia cenocepacia]
MAKPMPSIDEQYYRDTVTELCDLARTLSRAVAPDTLAITRKRDASPVTELDKRIELALRTRIQARHPLDSIVGEEFGVVEGRAGGATNRTWIIDPLDGTRAFVTGSPLWGTLVGVLCDGVPWLGAIDMPALGQRLIASSTDAATHVDPTAGTAVPLAAARMCTTTPDKFKPDEQPVYARLVARVAVHRYGGDCFNYAALASGRCDLVVESGLAPHDFLPIVPIVEAAGGRMTDWRGRRLGEHSAGDVVAASSGALHASAIALLSRSNA